jgi:hypothetical protein
MTLLEWTNHNSCPRALRLFVFLFLLLTAAITVTAQSATATLSGTVSDQNGALVSNANVAVINIAQGFQRNAVTTSDGTFVVSLLPPGAYTVKTEREGFTTSEVKNVVLNINDRVSLQIELKVGGVSGINVDVVDRISLANDSPAIGTVVDHQFVENLPLNGHSFQSLIFQTPGTIPTKANGSEGGQFSVNGQRADANYFTLDGVSANAGVSPAFGVGQGAAGTLPALSASGSTNNLVSLDALEEFKVLTSTYAPEFGRTPGGQIQMVTRSGTNELHGTLFDYLRNDVFDANDWFANANRLAKPALRQNDFGGVVGGPVVLPRFGEGGHGPAYNGRGKTFFFFSYEGLRLRLPQTLITTVPSVANRAAASPAIQPFLNAFPLPNGRILTNGAAEFASGFSNPSTIDATSIRIDHNFKQMNLFVRYNYSPTNTTTRGGNFSLNTLNPATIKTQSLTIGHTWVNTSGVGNEFRVNWTKLDAATEFFIDGLGGAVAPPDSLLFPTGFNRNNAILIFDFAGGGSGAQWDIGSNSSNAQKQFNIVDNLSFSRDQHQLKFGIDYRQLRPTFGPRHYAQIVDFDDEASTLSGLATDVIVSAATGGTLKFHNLSFYGQDTWKPMRRLTFTYGLRWEINPAPAETHGNGPFAITETNGDLSSIAIAPGNTQLYKTTFNNFAPRFGVAYQLRGAKDRETIVRGGFGVFYDLGTGPAGDILTGYPYLGTKVLLDVPFPLSPTAAIPPTLFTSPIGAFTGFDPKLKLPYTYQFNTTVQQSLGPDQSVLVSYIGAVGRRLLRRDRFTNPNPRFTTVTLIRNFATSDYNSLQLQYVRRLTKGLQATASYTWAHSIDTASNDSGAWPPGQRLDPSNERGPSDFDVRHAVTGAMSYELPKSGVMNNAFLRDWSIDGLFSARTATPVNVVTGTTLFGIGSTLRPDLVNGVPVYIEDPLVGGGRRINRNAFVVPPAGRQGTLGRNALRGFPMWQVDLALRRQFNLSERFIVQFRAEAFNLFNHPNFGDPGARATLTNSLTNPLFGQSTLMLGKSLGSGGIQPGLNPLYQIGGPRSMQFALKLKF